MIPRLTLCMILAVAPAAAHEEDEEIREISASWQLFLDDELLHRTEEIVWWWHDPIDQGPVLAFDRKWEGLASGYTTVLGEPGNYLLYYRGWDGKDPEKAVTCVARSKDGIEWARPDVGRYKWKGSRKNNIILKGRGDVNQNFAPFVDRNPKGKESQRYKAIAGLGVEGTRCFASEDGIRWKAMQGRRAFKKQLIDSQNVVFWSPQDEAYVCYQRHWVWRHGEKCRWVSRCTSRNLRKWSRPEDIELKSDRDWNHIYVNQTTTYPRCPELFLSFAGRYMPAPSLVGERKAERWGLHPAHLGASSDTVLLVSRDGLEFEDPSPRVLIRPGGNIRSWAARSNFAARNLLFTGPEEMSIYVVKNYGLPSCALHRYSLRTDGFVSAFAGPSGGRLITKEFRIGGDELRVNFACSAGGWVKVAVLDLKGRPLEGFDTGDFRTLRGDSVDHRCEWKKGAKLDALRDSTVRLMFDLREADLFSWRLNSGS